MRLFVRNIALLEFVWGENMRCCPLRTAETVRGTQWQGAIILKFKFGNTVYTACAFNTNFSRVAHSLLHCVRSNDISAPLLHVAVSKYPTL